MRKTLAAFIVSGIWISISEFVRNEILFKSYWLDKYSSIGIVFPSEPVNNALWGVWSFMLSGLIVYLTPKLQSHEIFIAAWMPSFAMMWIVTGNLNVLPVNLLLFAVPLSIVEVVVAAWLSRRILFFKE